MKKQVQHRQSIDLARFCAAFGVVFSHAFPTTEDWVGHLSVGLFLILTAFLAMQSMQRAGGRYGFVARAQKLVVPWLLWSAFFRVVDLVVSDTADRFILLENPWTLLIGSSIHLWFLPFIMGAMAFVQPVGRRINSPARLIRACAGLVALSVPFFWAHDRLGLPEPLPQWLIALPVYLLGLLMGIAQAMGRPVPTLAAAAGMSLVAYIVTGGAPWFFTPLAAVLVFEALWRLPMQARFLPALGQAAFGIYLLHPFMMLVVYKLFGSGVAPMFSAVAAFLMSWAGVVVARKIPLVARLM